MVACCRSRSTSIADAESEVTMQIGMIGLVKMGANMARRLMKAGHELVVFDRSTAAIEQLASEGARPAESFADLCRKLAPPRTLCMIVPAGIVGAVLNELMPLLQGDDTVIDGGNSHYQDDIARAAECRAQGLNYVDMGTSGGVWGLERGYCLMIGGESRVVERLDPMFRALAPGRGEIATTPGRSDTGTAELGYLHC